MHRFSRRDAIIVGLACATTASALGAQAATAGAGAQIIPAAGTFSPCTMSGLGAPGTTQSGTCSVASPSFGASASAVINSAIGGTLMSSIFVNDPNGVPNTPGTFVEASAGMFEYVSLSGPVDQIFRAVMRSTVGVNASLGRSSGSAYVELYLANVLANGVGGARQGSVIARSNFTSSNAFFGSIVADISGSLLQGVNEFAFGLSVDTQNMGSGGSMFAVANATVPEVELLDASGNDITNEFVVTYNPTTPPVTATPEPTSLALLATGFAGLARFRRRRTI